MSIQKKHILFISPTGAIGGAEINLIHMCRELKKDFEITVLLPEEGELKDQLSPLGITLSFMAPKQIQRSDVFGVLLMALRLVWRFRKSPIIEDSEAK